MIAKSHRWQKTTLAAAATVLFGFWGPNAAALSVGRITVLSALGEPLRADVDVPDINAEEAASIKASVALPEAFRVAGLEYNPIMAGLQATLQRRADGRAYIRLSSDRSVNDPFVDMILEVNWATGRIVRDYTLLFDPPNLRQTTLAMPSTAQLPVRPSASNSASSDLVAPAPTTTRPAQSGIGVKAPTRQKVEQSGSGVVQVNVKPGDTASKIAAATKPAKVSLDQMLVALLHTNPAAFTGDNVNRIKAGALINIPSAEQVATISPTEAAQIVVAQSRDFNDFRRKLAGSAPTTAVAAADRKVSGNLQAKVEDRKSIATAPDKLTLSKGVVQKQATENQQASERNAKEAASRAAEITKNISDLSKLGAASSAVAPSPAAPAVTTVSPVPGVVATATIPATPAALTPATAASAALPQPVAATASAPTQPASAVVKRPVPVPAPRAEVGLVDGLIENPLVPAGAIGLIALLAFFGFYRSRQRKNASRVDSIFLESRLRPDSFFGASGGQSVDTNDNAAAGSSMVYSTSQLDAVDNVDPVAEADVYLAYGRDLQAEEILKDALRTNPGRIAIHQKLLDIFAKRLDSNSFESIASSAFKVTGGEGPDWVRICELGLSIDPTNDLYLPGGRPRNPDGTPSRPASLDFISNLAASSDNMAKQDEEPLTAGTVDLDLDLDFSLDERPASSDVEATAYEGELATAPLDLDFGLATAASPLESDTTSDTHADELSRPGDDVTPEDSMTEPSVDNENFKAQAAASFGMTARAMLEPTVPDASSAPNFGITDIDDFQSQAAASFGMTTPTRLEPAAPEASSAPNFGMMEFDLGSLSLDLGETSDTVHKSVAEANQDPLSTKLALAEEFSAIGDDDGARALIQEVISEASGDMKAKAQNALNNL